MHDTRITRVSILSLSSSLEGLWSDVRTSAIPSLLITAWQSPALDTTKVTIPYQPSHSKNHHYDPPSSRIQNLCWGTYFAASSMSHSSLLTTLSKTFFSYGIKNIMLKQSYIFYNAQCETQIYWGQNLLIGYSESN